MVAFKCSTPKVWELLSPRQSLTASRRLPIPLPDAMLGLVAEFSQEPFIEGKEFISPMRGVLDSGPHPPRKALNAKVTVITVTEPLPINVTEPLSIDFGSGHAGGWSAEEVDRFDAACKERMRTQPAR
jgi:hypothetical protein